MQYVRTIAEEPVSVTADELRQGSVYFFLHYADEQGLVPSVEPVVFVGFGLRNDPDKVYFQDAESFFQGANPFAESDLGGHLYTGSRDEMGHVFAFEGVLEELIRCSIRRGDLG